jgi:hypothetical protein
VVAVVAAVVAAVVVAVVADAADAAGAGVYRGVVAAPGADLRHILIKC